MTDSIRVFIRSRPVIREDFQTNNDIDKCISVLNSGKEILITRSLYEQRRYQFDHVFTEKSSEEQVFEVTCHNLVSDLLSGINRTVLTYGQTSSGKTYTIFGPPDEPLLSGEGDFNALSEQSGLLPRAIVSLFEQIKRERLSCEVAMSYLQIYKNDVFDLLQPQLVKLTAKELKTVPTIPVASAQDIFHTVTAAVRQRIVAATEMNAQSSRSHVVLLLYLRTETNCQSVLTLVDLAGSERVARTMSTGERLAEANDINNSLTCLGKCVRALAAGKPFVPFRDCALTRLLEPSLQGNCRTHLIAAISPTRANYDESNSTLEFASRCMRVLTAPQRNEYQFELEKSTIKFDSEQEMTILGQFMVEDGCGLVKCQCPRCGVNLIILDEDIGQEADEDEGGDQPTNDRPMDSSEIEYEEILVGKQQTRSNSVNRYKDVIKSLNNEIEALKAENNNYREFANNVLSAVKQAFAGNVFKEELQEVVGYQPRNEQPLPQDGMPDENGGLEESVDQQMPEVAQEPLPHVLNLDLPPPHPNISPPRNEPEPTTYSHTWRPEHDDNTDISKTAHEEEYSPDSANRDEPLVIRPREVQLGGSGYKPIKLLNNGEYKPFTIPREFKLSKCYPEVVYDPANKRINEFE